jgi:hypothetical protein
MPYIFLKTCINYTSPLLPIDQIRQSNYLRFNEKCMNYIYKYIIGYSLLLYFFQQSPVNPLTVWHTWRHYTCESQQTEYSESLIHYLNQSLFQLWQLYRIACCEITVWPNINEIILKVVRERYRILRHCSFDRGIGAIWLLHKNGCHLSGALASRLQSEELPHNTSSMVKKCEVQYHVRWTLLGKF